MLASGVGFCPQRRLDHVQAENGAVLECLAQRQVVVQAQVALEPDNAVSALPGHFGLTLRISPRRVEQILEEWLKRAGLAGRGYSPHKLRHTAATLLYQYGEVDIRVAQYADIDIQAAEAQNTLNLRA